MLENIVDSVVCLYIAKRYIEKLKHLCFEFLSQFCFLSTAKCFRLRGGVALQVEAISREDGAACEEQDGVDYVADTADEDDDFDEDIEAGDDGNDGSVALQAEAFRVKMMVVNCLIASA